MIRSAMVTFVRRGLARSGQTAVLLAAAALAAGAGWADGILVPERPDAPRFAVKYHRVEVSIKGQVATTSIDQVFENRSTRQEEAVYVFPLPHGAAVREFTLYDRGHPLHAELLDRDKAREIYESIVRRRKDPGLLEYIGRDTYRVRVFPIPAKGSRRIQIEYTELLKYDSGLVTYVYPLSTEKFSAEPIEEVKVEIKVESTAPIHSVYSPTHDVEVDKPESHVAYATLEEHGTRPDRDLVLHYSVSEEDVGTSVLTHKERDEDGFFLLMAAPSSEMAKREVRPKDVVFVLDRSGSMSGEKIEQAKGALEFFLNSLNRQDRFRLITFSNRVRVHGVGEGLMPASREEVREARAMVEEIEAGGGTDIHSALESALEMDFTGERASYIVFLTDGLPTVGETDIATIVKHVGGWNHAEKGRQARLFVFGAGYDVNTHFLEKLAQGNGGVTEYVRPNEDIEVKVSRFFAKVARPVLTDLELSIPGVETYDIFPAELPDLFAGSQLLVFGRYRTKHPVLAKVSLVGHASPERRQFGTSVKLPTAEPDHAYIAPLWANRKIGYLLDQIMIHGQKDELVDEVIELSQRYGILTEYTAFLAEEGSRLSFADGHARFEHEVAPAAEAKAGAWATSQRQNARRLKDQSALAAQNVQLDRDGNVVAFQQAQTRNNQGFFNRAGNWEDARYRVGVQQVVKVKAFSEAYFQLSRRDPTLNQYFSLGDRVLVVVNDRAIQIADEGKELFTEAELDALLGKAKTSAQAQETAVDVAEAEGAVSIAASRAAAALLLAVACCTVLVRSRSQRLG